MFQAEGTAWLGNVRAVKEEGRKCMVRESWGSGRPKKGVQLLLTLGAAEGLQASKRSQRAQLRALACVLELGGGNRSFKPCSSDQSWCFLSESQGS